MELCKRWLSFELQGSRVIKKRSKVFIQNSSMHSVVLYYIFRTRRVLTSCLPCLAFPTPAPASSLSSLLSWLPYSSHPSPPLLSSLTYYFLIPDWLFPCNSVTLQKYFWRSLFSEYHSHKYITFTGPTILDLTKQHCRNKRSMITQS